MATEGPLESATGDSQMQDVLNKARHIRLAIFDVDGVLTDGRLYYGPAGEVFKVFHSHDGHGVKMLRQAGIDLALLSGRDSPCVDRRAAELGIQLVYQGIEDKLACYEQLLAELGLEENAAAFMGDEVVDLPVMRRCGLALSVPEAPPWVKRHAHYVTHRSGGAGAVREACELMLRAQGALQPQLDRCLR